MEEVEVLSMITNTADSLSMKVVLLGVFAAMAFAAILASKFGEWVLPRPKETRVADFLPFSRLDEDGYTLHCKNGSLARVYELKGADTTLLLPEERAALMGMRQQWIQTLAELEVTARLITIRERIPLRKYAPHKNELLKEISSRWIDALRRIYKNKHYVVLSVPERKNSEKDLSQAGQALIAVLDAYNPVLVSEKTPERHEDKSPFWLFARLASPLTRPQPLIGSQLGDELNSLLTADSIIFTKDEGIVKYKAGDRQKLGIVIGIRKPGDSMDEQMIADLLSIDMELNLVHNVQPMNFVKANLLLEQQRRMARLTSPSQNVQEQYMATMEMLDQSDANAQTLNKYAMTIYLFADSKEELRFGQDEVERICRYYNVTPVREGWAAQATFFSQFPTYEVYPKTFMYLSRVVACALCMDKTAEGLLKSDWGDGPISYFRTITGTAYAFQFHVSSDAYAVAHTA